MTVYVDNARNQFRRMVMCHMIADEREELLSMATKIGLKREWLQREDTPYEHFDLSLTRRAEAIQHGAVVVTTRELVRIIRKKKDVQNAD